MNILALDLARLPNVSLEIMQRLAKTLVRDKSSSTNVVIEAALAQLLTQIKRVDLAGRLPDSTAQDQARASFDDAVSGLCNLLRRSLELQAAYAHPGLDALPQALADEAALEPLRHQARRARWLGDRLFGDAEPRGASSAESMGALLRVIEEYELREELEDAVGADLIQLLEACEVHYQQQLEARLESGLGLSRNELRDRLRWVIVAYIHAVHSLYERSEPQTATEVLLALRAVLSVRESFNRTGVAALEGLVELECHAVMELKAVV